MVRIVDEVLINLGVNTKQFTAGLAAASNAGKSFVASMQKNSAALAALSVVSAVSFGAQIKLIQDVTNEYAKQQDAVVKLSSLLKPEQRTRADSVKILTAQADALQKVTQFADEEIISMQANLAAFGQTDAAIEKLTPLLLDTAAGFRDVEGNALDLKTVALAVGKALNGDSASLKKLGIDLGLAKGEVLTLEKVLAALEQRYLGAAEAAGTTFSGQLKIMANRVSEVKEAIGEALAPSIIDLINIVSPYIEKAAAWASAHKDIVLTIVGGGLAGGGLLAALASLGAAVALFGVAGGGWVALAVIGIAALVGWLIKLKVAADDVPRGVDQLNQAIADQTKKLAALEKQIESMPEPFSIFALGSKKNDLRDEAEKVRERIALLKGELDKIPAAVDGAFVGPPEPTPLAAKTDAEIKKLKELAKWQEKVGLAPDTSPTLGSMGIEAAGPINPDAMGERSALAQGIMDDYVASVKEGNEAIAASDADLLARQLAALDQWAEGTAQTATGIATSIASLFLDMAQQSQNLQNAIGKTIVVGLIRALRSVVQMYTAQVIAFKLKEIGIALMGAPLSFGGTLAAIGPIVAASAVALAGLGAIESTFMKQNAGFEQGGVIPRTGHFLMHEGEVVYNPRRNSPADLAANLARAGATREAAAVAGGGGFNVNFWGDVRSQADVLTAMRQIERRWQRSLGTAA